jgi:O-methyltransferase
MSASDPLTIRRAVGRSINRVLAALDVKLVDGIAPRRAAHDPGIAHSRVLPAATYSPWLDDAPFLDVYERIRDHTLVDLYRCYELWQIAQQMSAVRGAILEVGVWRGGTGALLAAAVKRSERTVYLADTFKGVVKAGPNDASYSGGEHADASEATVRELLTQLELTNAQIVAGIFPDETCDLVREPIALLHCDVDVYQSSRDVMAWALPRLVPHGVVVFDDYGFAGTEGVTRVVNEFRSRDDLLFIHNLNGHAIFIKRSL